jgi:alanyl-tRNA synthetase
LLKSRPGELPHRIQALQGEVRSLRKSLEKVVAQAASSVGRHLLDDVELIGNVRVLASRTKAPGIKALRELLDDVRSKLPSGVVCLTAEEGDKVSLIIAVSKDLLGRFTAPALIGDVAAAIGGSGGGRPELAQAGGTNAAGIDQAFAILKKRLGQGRQV